MSGQKMHVLRSFARILRRIQCGYSSSQPLEPIRRTVVIETHRDLEVWEKSVELCVIVYRWTRGFPDEERFGLTSQIRRAAVSVASNIAEGAARGTKRDFIRFLHIARGSLAELETHMEIVCRCGISTLPGDLRQHGQTVGRMLNGLLRALSR